MGATGFVTHVGNFWPEYPRRLWRLMREGAHAELMCDALVFKRDWHRWTERVMAYTEGEGPFIKAALDAVGLPSGAPFPPSLPVPDELRQELRRLFDEYDVPMA
jgi:dihydrodipicolinate synthase/N-acetylneuraminate lyase